MLKPPRFLAGAFCMIASLLHAQTVQSRAETLQQVAALIQRGDLTSAENALAGLLKTSPDDPLALNLLGLIRMRQHDPGAAADLFRKAIQTGHRVAGPHINLALIDGSDHPFEAISELQQAFAIAPGDEQATSLLRQIVKDSVLAAIKSGDKDKALALLAKARALLPHDAELLYDSGFIAFECGSYQEADRYLSEALERKPDYLDAQYALAQTYLAENLAKPAEDEMRKYLSAKPDDAAAQYGLGYILMAEQKVDEATAAFERSVSLQPEQTESVYQLGEIALQQGDVERAKGDFKTVLARDPHHGGALTDVGVLAYRAAEYAEAKADLERAIESAPQYQKAHYYYALTLSKLGRKEQAEHEFALARSLQKEHGGEHHLLAAQP